jgi:two-component system, chemotaxis family, CheB/CheR fusion protein
MPQRPGLAVVVVVHLSPEHESRLAEVLQPYSSMPVQQVNGPLEIQPNHVYLIPPGANLESIDTHLRPSKLEATRRERAPIDHFLRTLAETHDGNSIGVVLTGSGSDGTLGIRRIKEHGGLTIAQDPDEAEHDGMPRSAIATGMVDLVLPLREIPAQLLRFVETHPRVPEVADDGELSEDANRLLHKIFAQIRGRTGHDFSKYKQSTIMRRIRRRMQIHHIEALGEYLDILRDRRDEPVELFNDLLITVTEFFRDPQVFEAVERDVIPALFEGKTAHDRVRVWSVGCSTGEEAYSLAMLLVEQAGRQEQRPQIQVFASDLHDRSLEVAREGVYPLEIAADVSPERLDRFFVREGGAYRVRRELREIVIFAPHDLLRDPPFSHLDLVVCRNVLIYLQRDVQQDVVSLFHYALDPGGWLVLGTSETIDNTELFSIHDKAHAIHRRCSVPTGERGLRIFPISRAAGRRPHGESPQREPPGYGPAHERMVERYAPPSILVNQNNDVVHTSARAGRYMQLPGGETTRNVFKLVLEPLRIELRGALHTAAEGGAKGASVRSRPVT